MKSDGTRRLYKAMILACLNWAASGKVRLIASNPLRGKLDLPEGGSRGGDAVWTPAVFKIVTENVNDRFADFLRALAWTGARPSTVRRVEARHYRPAPESMGCRGPVPRQGVEAARSSGESGSAPRW